MAVTGDDHPGQLTDDLAPQPDPALSGKLQAKPGPDRVRGRRGDAGWLQDHQEDPGSTSECPETSQALGDATTSGPPRQIDDEQVHRPGLEERPCHLQPLVEVDGSEDGQPLESDPPGHRLDRIEAAGQVEPGGDRPDRLGLGHQAERQRGPAARGIAPQGDRGGPGDAAGAQDGVESRETRGHDRDRWAPARASGPGREPELVEPRARSPGAGGPWRASRRSPRMPPRRVAVPPSPSAPGGWRGRSRRPDDRRRSWPMMIERMFYRDKSWTAGRDATAARADGPEDGRCTGSIAPGRSRTRVPQRDPATRHRAVTEAP